VELPFLSLTEQCEWVRSGRLSSLELTRAYIERIKRLNAPLNIVIQQDFDAALERASELDRRLKETGQPAGPLHGIPFTIKDAFRVKGMGSSYGLPGMQYLPAWDDCTIVQRLRDAGAILLGLTNVPLSCFDWQSNSPVYGLTRNPLNPAYTVGGSSGGSAASLAAHFTPFEIGSDVAGSIRYPAHCCGVFGLRPSHDSVPFSEAGPSLHKKTFANVCVAGPMARSIEDVRIVLGVLIQATSNAQRKTKLKIAYTLDWAGIVPEKDSMKAIHSFIGKLEAHGHVLTPLVPDLDFNRCTELWGMIVGYEYQRMIPAPLRFKAFLKIFNYYFNVRRLGESLFQKSFEKGLLAAEPEYRQALKDAEVMRRRFAGAVQDCDLWLTPVSAGPAIPHQKTGTLQTLHSKTVTYPEYLGNFLTPTSILHHPILVGPVGTSDNGLPVGVQLHGKYNQDWQLLSNCELLQDCFLAGT
jgi:amidase